MSLTIDLDASLHMIFYPALTEYFTSAHHFSAMDSKKISHPWMSKIGIRHGVVQRELNMEYVFGVQSTTTPYSVQLWSITAY